jgi:hypothetical protein
MAKDGDFWPEKSRLRELKKIFRDWKIKRLSRSSQQDSVEEKD